MARKTSTWTVVRTERIARHMVRVVLGDPGFETFEPSEFTDSYVKIEFGSGDDTVLRTYTVRSVDPVAREIAIDFVVHGDEGVAGPWAASVQPGATVTLRGPGGAYTPRADADWHLIAGDESALPAISTALAALAPDAVARVFIEVADVDDEIALPAGPGVQVSWIHRGTTSDAVGEDISGTNAPLVSAVRAMPWLPGDVHVFIHGEADAVMHGLRPYIRKEHGVPAASASISGYWRRGRTEEGFRVWKSELAAAEATAH
ncbi:siderophore-interacting protein [Prescottella equi]|uniref:siderophore-interacting protein n=1 Tax=Rhodococcus hoagii TaxID=43767 RepID=UPI000A11FD86|nr:siderophore-interacting protein [Prescottella equi]ORM03840.1 NADPH-dependent ferric siderophore reductase [Prescottella equi]ORM10359.1 NADPH-dependent ferric siderophore reductase [Prescottella equi]